ncbi:MAG: hypothetical protein JWO42_323, partial [Chloroflexi bacterium]|nr:hypothetical protein [Chloroflexota bacterium]
TVVMSALHSRIEPVLVAERNIADLLGIREAATV